MLFNDIKGHILTYKGISLYFMAFFAFESHGQFSEKKWLSDQRSRFK